MAGGVVAGPVGLGDDADALGLDAQGDDLALELVAGLLEGADVAMSLLLCCSSPRPSRPRWRSAGRRRSTTHPLAGRSAAEDGGGETFLARARNGRSPGEESRTAAVAASGDRGAAVLWPDHAIRGHVARAGSTALREEVAEIE